MCRNPIHCMVPPFVLDKLAECPDAKLRKWARQSIDSSGAARAKRATLMHAPTLLISSATAQCKDRAVYTAEHKYELPGKLIRAEGWPRVSSDAANEAYNGSGEVFDFYKSVFGRNSLDDGCMTLTSTVHFGRNHENAFWDGSQMAYGDGDGTVFRRFTRSLDVIGHELSHGVVTFTANLEYRNEPGAVNEHMADVFGTLIRQRKNGESARSASWLIGEDIIVKAPTRHALRDMSDPGTAFINDPYLGTDPQPWHYADRYRGSDDNGGVHINSGIPNFAFFATAYDIGGRAWSKAGKIWYIALAHKLRQRSRIRDLAGATIEVAKAEYGTTGSVARIVKNAWKEVGVLR